MMYFLDSYALFAWVNANAKEVHHAQVKAIFSDVSHRYVTTEWVLLEFADGLCAPKSRSIAHRMSDKIRTTNIFEVITYDIHCFESGLALYKSRPDKAWSL